MRWLVIAVIHPHPSLVTIVDYSNAALNTVICPLFQS